MTHVVRKNRWCSYSSLKPAAMLEGSVNEGATQTIVTSYGSGATCVEKVDSPKAESAPDCAVEMGEKGVCPIQRSTSSGTSQLSPSKPSDPPSLIYSLKQKRVLEKFIYVTSVLTLAFLVHALLTAQWLLPYYYAVSAPVLLLIRLVLYWRLKWQYFLLDFCYTANTLWYIYLWAVPANAHLFSVVFSLANGPLLWAVVVYRNSLVFHSLDKVTSAYIHLLPTFLSFGVRWYGETSSVYWYTPFLPTPMEPSFVWLVAVPLACFIVHSLIYSIVVNVILRPSDEFLTSYRYLTTREGTWLYKFFKFFRPSLRIYVYFLFNWVFCSITLLVAYVVFKYFIAHCVALAFVVLVCVFNGASFYMDVFSVRGFQDDD